MFVCLHFSIMKYEKVAYLILLAMLYPVVSIGQRNQTPLKVIVSFSNTKSTACNSHFHKYILKVCISLYSLLKCACHMSVKPSVIDVCWLKSIPNYAYDVQSSVHNMCNKGLIEPNTCPSCLYMSMCICC